MLHLPFVMYADFESILKPKQTEEGRDDQPWTVTTINSKKSLLSTPVRMQQFIDHVLGKAAEIRAIYCNKISPILTTTEKITQVLSVQRRIHY